jgi:hypothetical protein
MSKRYQQIKAKMLERKSEYTGEIVFTRELEEAFGSLDFKRTI